MGWQLVDDERLNVFQREWNFSFVYTVRTSMCNCLGLFFGFSCVSLAKNVWVYWLFDFLMKKCVPVVYFQRFNFYSFQRQFYAKTLLLL